VEPGGKAAGVIGIERIAIERKKEREDWDAWKWNGAW
jgi:hypothetical protein